MTYPSSSPVSSGQPTFAAHFNNLRLDALTLGQPELDVVPLGTFLKRFASGFKISLLGTNRVRVLYDTSNPPSIMVNSHMLQANANVDLPAGLIAGAAATWYIFAVRTAAVTSFTLTANTSAVEGPDQRLVAQLAWDGIKITSIINYIKSGIDLNPPDYDSGWFAVAANGLYTKAHGLGTIPSLVQIFHCDEASGLSGDIVPVVGVELATGLEKSVLGYSSMYIIANSGTNVSTPSTCFSLRRESSSGYWRFVAWR